MSQYNSMPPPGAYVPPSQNQSTPTSQSYGGPHQQQSYQPLQAGTAYQPPAQGYHPPSQSHKGNGGTFGQMMNQAVTTSKPMLNKLSKTISSKLGNKPTSTGTPQHLQSFQNYQQHHSQQTQSHTPPQSHTFNPHAQQAQQQQHVPSSYAPQQSQQQPQAQSPYATQQSPHEQSNVGSGQGNYFAQQTAPIPPPPHTQATPPPQVQHVGHNLTTQLSQGMNAVKGQQGHTQHGHQQQNLQGYNQSYNQSYNQGQSQFQHTQQPLQAQHTGQQLGVVGASPQLHQGSNPQSPQMHIASPQSPAPHQVQWQSSHAGSEQSPASTYQQPPPSASGSHTQSYFPSAHAETQVNNQQWDHLSPTASERIQSPFPPASVSPPPPPMQSHTTIVPSVSPQQSQSATPAPQSHFIAELPADLDSLSLSNTKPTNKAPALTSGQTPQYQAYQSPNTQTGPSSPGFTIARRAVSISSAPYADPWRFADPLTELPTREFYVIADLLFDALDRKCEPQNTGMLEASKILRSWIDLTEDAIQLFSYNSYIAFAKLWTLQGIPHVMVPCQPSLAPTWNFNQHSHAHEMKLSAVPAHASTSPVYIPALNRPGWYKFFFLEMMHGPDNINKLLPALCSESYKPGILHHPDLSKRDKAEAPALQAMAAEIQATAIDRVCTEIKATMLVDTDV